MCANKNFNDYRCNDCSVANIFTGLKIVSKEETLNEIIINKKSITRFGDGEYRLIFGENAGLQKYNETLAKRLLDILNSDEKNLLIGINIPYKKKDLDERSDASKGMWKSYFRGNKLKIARIINKKKIYYSALISRFYSTFKDRTNSLKYIFYFKKIWNNRDVLIIEGEKTRVGIGNDLLNNSKSIKRILCPNVNAFNVYEKIISYVKHFDKNVLILIALGPTATVLAYDLYKLNYQVVDIGHIDIEYELYLRKAKHMISIPSKLVFEAAGGTSNISNVTDINYYNQIAFKVLN
jgi:glycosyltransferase family protein